jgi:hypothetical protein
MKIIDTPRRPSLLKEIVRRTYIRLLRGNIVMNCSEGTLEQWRASPSTWNVTSTPDRA